MANYKQLCDAIEQAVHRQMETPADFDWLEERIAAATGERLSASTLMRVWGYRESVATRKTTLDILARFLGKNSFSAFVSKDEECVSNIVKGKKLEVASDLHQGDHIRLTWLPDRVCDVLYEGGMRFRVIRSEKTHLQVGDTFECPLMIEGEPLYLDRLQRDGMSPMTYVCGKKGGIRFQMIC